MNKQKHAFTLVELIVVITILAILWTIAFISLQWYSRDSRDSVRISDMSSIKTTLELFHLWAGKYPITTDGTPILYSWTEAWTQGSFWESTVSNIDKFDKIPTDPLMDRQYVYSVTEKRQEYEIAWIVEWDTIWLDSTLINESLAWNKVTKTKITWNYNGKFLKISTGGIDYVLNIPSIITSTWGTLDYILANNWLAYNWYSNLPLQYDWSAYTTMWESPEIRLVNAPNIVAYSGSFEDLRNVDQVWIDARNTLITNAQTAYTWTTLVWINEINELLTVNPIDSWAVEFLWRVVTNNDLSLDIDIVTIEPFIPSLTVDDCGITKWEIIYWTEDWLADWTDPLTCDDDIIICRWTIWLWYIIKACNEWATTVFTNQTFPDNDISWDALTDARTLAVNEWAWWLYQWWNNAELSMAAIDWNQIWATTDDSSYNNPAFFINGNADWASPANDNLWWDITNTSIARRWPCDEWYHVPSQEEWYYIIDQKWRSWNLWTLMMSDLKMPMAGGRDYNTADMWFQGTRAWYWTSRRNWTTAYYIRIEPSVIFTAIGDQRPAWYSVRCMKN